MDENDKREPEAVFRDRELSVKIWRNTSEKSGRDYFNATISKSYKDERGEWRQSNSYNRDDLLRLRELAGNASVEMRMLQDQARQYEREQEQDREGLETRRDDAMRRAAPDQSPSRRRNSPDKSQSQPRER